MTYNKVYGVGYQRDYDRGVRRYVPIQPVRDHVLALMAAGGTGRMIASASGLAPSTISQIARTRPGQKHVQRHVAQVLLRLTPRDLYAAGKGCVPSVGTHRRIRALLALGWRHQDISRYGCKSSDVLLASGGDLITTTTYRSICAAYDALSMRPGPSDRTRRRAARAGYAPPLAWDDFTIDDPAAGPQRGSATGDQAPDEIAIDAAVHGRRVDLTRDERVEATRRLAQQGLTDHQIAERLGVADRTVLRDRKASDIPSRWEELSA